MLGRSFLFAACAVLFFRATSFADLIHQYKFDDASTANGTPALDEEGTRNGTYLGDIESVSGYLSGPDTAAHFDGVSDGVLLSDTTTSVVGALPNFTLAALIQVDSGYDSGDRFLYNESAASDALHRPTLLFRFTNGDLEFGIYRNFDWQFATIDLEPGALNPANWYIVGASLSATLGESIYLIDGISHNTIASSSHPNTLGPGDSTNNATIGAWTGSLGFAGQQNTFTGVIDDFRIYDTALSEAEIQLVPEPGTVSLLGLAALLGLRRRR